MPQTGARLSLIPSRPVTGVIGNVVDFDSTTQRTRDARGQAIRHPKESTESLTDDVILEPVVLQVTAHYTDHPLYYGPSFGGYGGRSEDLASAVRAVQTSKTPCLVIYGDEIFPSMVIESMSEPRTAQTGDAVDIDLTLVEIDIGELALVTAIVDAQTQALGDIDTVDIGWLP